MAASRQRLDRRLVDLGLAPSRQRAQALIMAGKVLLNDRPADKPGTAVREEDTVVLRGEDIPYVSRGGLKLEAALASLQLDVDGLDCLDVGASTGGFTDCLLQHGAAHVFAVDVGYGQMDWKLRNDDRVTVIERTNIRHMPETALPRTVDLVTIDTSFISLRIVVPAVLKFLKPAGRILALIKPQFEVGKGEVGKGGVVRESWRHEAVITSLGAFFEEIALVSEAVVPSPVRGPKGNQEFVIALVHDGKPA